MNKPIKIISEHFNDYLYLLNKDKYEVVTEINNFSLSYCDDDDNNIYMPYKRTSHLKLKNNIIDITREHDLTMLYFLMQQENILNLSNITPNFIYCYNLKQYLQYMKPDTKYLLKPFDCARTLGQVIVTKETFLQMFYDTVDDTKEHFNKKYKIDTRTARDEKEEFLCYRSLKNNNFYLSEFVDFDTEFRILYIKDIPSLAFIVEERAGYGIVDQRKRTSKIIKNSKYSYLHEILQYIKTIGDNHYSPIISFDIWVKCNKNNDCKFGIFEYCTEMGIHYEPNEDVPDPIQILTYQVNRVFDLYATSFGLLK